MKAATRLQSAWRRLRARDDFGQWVLLGGILLVFAVLKGILLARWPNLGPDGSYYVNVAQNIRDGYGVVSHLSIYYKGYPYLPYPSDIYPVWPLLLGYLGRVMNIFVLSRWLPTVLFFAWLIMTFLWARRAFPGQLFQRIPALRAGHLLVIMCGLHRHIFEFTSRPFTEALALTILMVALWRAHRLWEQNNLRAGLELGLWLSLLLLTRSQLVLLAIAVFMTLAIALVVQSDRRQTLHMMAGTFIGFAALVLPQYLFLHSIIEDPSLFRFDQNRATDLLPRLVVVVQTDGLVDYVLDRLSGVWIAFNPWAKHSYWRSFHGLQYMLPVALPFLVAWGVAVFRSQRVPELIAWVRVRHNRRWICFGLFALGSFASIHIMHQDAGFMWSFAFRHAIVCVFLFFSCAIFLLRRKSAIARGLAVMLLIVATVSGLVDVYGAARTETSTGNHPAKVRRLARWLNVRAKASNAQLVVVAPHNLAKGLTPFTRNVGYHVRHGQSDRRAVEIMFNKLGAQLLISRRQGVKGWLALGYRELFGRGGWVVLEPI